MTLAEDVAAAAAEVGASAQAAADRVTAALGEARAQIATGLAEVQRLEDENAVEAGVLGGVKDSLTGTDAILDSIEPAPAPTP